MTIHLPDYVLNQIVLTPFSLMNKILITSILITITTFWQTAQANIQVAFKESAPKDQFSFTNVGKCVLDDLIVTIDLSNSAGKLIFDTVPTGSGVEVFQPFEIVNGNLNLVSSASSLDGNDELIIEITNLAPNKTASFTIDLDDTMKVSQLGNIRVAGSEISNAEISVKVGDQEISSASFGANSKAAVSLPSC